MTEEQKQKIDKKIMTLSISMLVILAVCMIGLGIVGKVETVIYPVLVAVFLFLYWAIADLLPLKWLRLLEDKTSEQKKSYYAFAAADLVSLIGLVYFIAAMQSMTGVFIFVGATFIKRKFHDDFTGKNKDGDDEEYFEDNSSENADAGDEAGQNVQIADTQTAAEEKESEE